MEGQRGRGGIGGGRKGMSKMGLRPALASRAVGAFPHRAVSWFCVQKI